MFRPMRTVTLALCCAGLVLGGCSANVEVNRQIAKADLEKGIADALQQSVGQRPDSITCPGPINAKQGEQMRCELAAGSTKYGLTATIKSVDGSNAKYDVQVDPKPSS
ncbi:protein of unknown function [Amycolatopsis saalfeldensis]|uniref:DUF4333 domain-containing protein n=2 Tax=Amycolatopsis saalfeldensis TaxID=394193 RepID=A0A1H8YHF6_9PSEU|nr:protein of unknown function [Amycolatopsis saalfeldensis]